MLSISNNKITLTRGDTMILEVNLKDESGEEYVPSSGDKIYFRLKKSVTAKDILIEKEIPYDTRILHLDEADTVDLKFGTYCYEIELVTESDYHFTVIANTEFEISQELEIHGQS